MLVETKEVDWSKWIPEGRPELSDIDKEIVRFCWPCDHLKRSPWGDPRCYASGSSLGRMTYFAFDCEQCPQASVSGKQGVMTRESFQPKPPASGH